MSVTVLDFIDATLINDFINFLKENTREKI